MAISHEPPTASLITFDSPSAVLEIDNMFNGKLLSFDGSITVKHDHQQATQIRSWIEASTIPLHPRMSTSDEHCHFQRPFPLAAPQNEVLLGYSPWGRVVKKQTVPHFVPVEPPVREAIATTV
jgi:hypothetical protein